MTHSAVIRARRNSPDVKGINRFKYFHSPVLNDFTKGNMNIDKKVTTLHLPQLNLGMSRLSDRTASYLNIASTGDNKQKITNQLPSSPNGLSVNIYQNVVFGQQMQPITVSTSLPHLETPVRKTKPTAKRGKGIVRSALDIPNGGRQRSQTTHRSFSNLIDKPPDMIIGTPLNPFLLPNKTTAPKSPKRYLPNITSNLRSPKPCCAKIVESRPEKITIPKAKIILTDCSSNTRLLEGYEAISESEVCIAVKALGECKATQTPPVSDHSSLRSASDSDVELERRNELISVVEQALDETIDRQSRLRVNQFIVSSARKQFEVWKDAKEFVTSILLPRSIRVANMTRCNRPRAASALPF